MTDQVDHEVFDQKFYSAFYWTQVKINIKEGDDVVLDKIVSKILWKIKSSRLRLFKIAWNFYIKI